MNRSLLIRVVLASLLVAAIVAGARSWIIHDADATLEDVRARLDPEITRAPTFAGIDTDAQLERIDEATEDGASSREVERLRRTASAIQYLNHDELVFAQRELNKLVPRHGWTPLLRSMAGEILRRQGQYSEARQQLEEALTLDESYARAGLLLAGIDLDEGDFRSAKVRLEEVVRQHRSSGFARNQLSIALEALGDTEGAYRQLVQATELSPMDPNVFLNYGRILQQLDQHERAEQAYQETLRLRPGDADAMLGLGLSASAQGNLAAAVQYYDQAAELAPEDPAPVIAAADMLRDHGRLDDAIINYRAALLREPNAVIARLKLANALVARRDFTEAVDEFQAVIDRAPQLASAFNGMGAALMHQGNRQRAEQVLRRAAELDERDANPYLNLGLLYEQDGRLNEARGAWRAALERSPGLLIAEQHLARLIDPA